MARKNRLVVEDGLYHITARVAHRARLLQDPAFKAQIVDWIYGIADFSGVEVCAWNVMDNHLHIFVHVPPVPEKYWLDPPATGTLPRPEGPAGTVPRTEGTAPCASAFSMRPPENRAPRWTPDPDGPACVVTPAGECPSREALAAAIAEGLPAAHVPQAPTGFAMSDGEMLGRLRSLYGPKSVDRIARRWAGTRAAGCGDAVEREKSAYCRRMYNVSQYMKTLKQRISQAYNRACGHEGQLWDGRFFSVLVDRDDSLARFFVTAYVELNSYRTKGRIAPKDWPWCSYAAATGASWQGEGPLARRAREGYERMFGVPWEEVVRRLESAFAAEMPADYDEKAPGAGRLKTMAQLVKVTCRQFERGGFVTRNRSFAVRTLAAFPSKFPSEGMRSVAFFASFRWGLAA